jgi:transposase-like protein
MTTDKKIAQSDKENGILCQNPECKYYLKVEAKAVIKRGKYRTGHQRYQCKHCGKFFMDTAGTAFYRKHLSKDEIRLIYRLYLEKNGIRSIERITGHHRDTISHLIRDTVKSEKTEKYLVKEIGLTANECEKLWTIIEKKRSMSLKLTLVCIIGCKICYMPFDSSFLFSVPDLYNYLI